ncbi:hypothetical protein AMC99_01836 [Altererythrobacter epoxidivorans]|uniref:Uncharacterized protein n=1 Tax=Altererythrobacter epoxidivorans TaxID=361183 RepID=A0A0M5KYS3_9SPHN|nr:hypothetical protein AMC99_01836 [Altererythrobacter epoxidivorans]
MLSTGADGVEDGSVSAGINCGEGTTRGEGSPVGAVVARVVGVAVRGWAGAVPVGCALGVGRGAVVGAAVGALVGVGVGVGVRRVRSRGRTGTTPESSTGPSTSGVEVGLGGSLNELAPTGLAASASAEIRRVETVRMNWIWVQKRTAR